MATSLSLTSSSSSGGLFPSVPVICEEIFDESCQPSEEEINDYAVLIGIDPIKESYLLYLAKEGLMQALPPDWKICYSEEKRGHYYYNIKTKKTQWDHPLDEIYRNLAKQIRQKHILLERSATDTISANTIPIIDNIDDMSQLDSGVRSLQVTDECDNTNNTINEISSPSIVKSNNGAIRKHTFNTIISNANGVFGGVNRFLESRSNNFTSPLCRLELSKTNTINNLTARFSNHPADKSISKFSAPLMEQERSGSNVTIAEKPITLPIKTFIKPRHEMEVDLYQTSATITNPNVITDTAAASSRSVKGILRDSSLTDVRRYLEKEEQNDSSSITIREDKKSVRFHLNELKQQNSSAGNGTSPKRLTRSPEISINSDDYGEENDDPWDDNGEEINEYINIRNLPLNSLHNPQQNLDQIFTNENIKADDVVKEIQLSEFHTIQMLKAQTFSMDVLEQNNLHKTETCFKSDKVTKTVPIISSESFMERPEDARVDKPIYEDTDSESKGNSVRSCVINKSEQHSVVSICPQNLFDLEELDRKHRSEVEQLELKLQNKNSECNSQQNFTETSKLISLFEKNDKTLPQKENVQSQENEQKENGKYKNFTEQLKVNHQLWLKEEKAKLECILQSQIEDVKREHEHKLKNMSRDYDLRLISLQHQLDESMELRLQEYRNQLENELNVKHKIVIEEHKVQIETLKNNYNKILCNLQHKLKNEEEILKKEHLNKLANMRQKFYHELELEKRITPNISEDRLCEKMRYDKRLLEDKYRCLKEKYIRLKNDIKLSVEKRNRRRAAEVLQQNARAIIATSSETERSVSNKPSLSSSENPSLTHSTTNPNNISANPGTGGKFQKPFMPPKLYLQRKDQLPNNNINEEDGNTVCTKNRKLSLTSKYIKHLQGHDGTTSLSQLDTICSNNYSKGRYLSVTVPHMINDDVNVDSEPCQSNQENNNNPCNAGVVEILQRKKQFSRLKSASTSRLNSDNYNIDRPRTPVENLRHQLKKLEDLEDQFPQHTGSDTTYHLRYPFSDISNAEYTAGTSSELEFFKHRIHLERDSVGRAKELLRFQKTNFKMRQNDIKHRYKVMSTRHSLPQLIQEEAEVTEMEVNLHRTRALLGEKIIRLRHLEQSLLHIYEREKPSAQFLLMAQKDDVTLSDLSSHSSSGFSSTEYGSGIDIKNPNKSKKLHQLNSKDCIKHLEILNAEIKDILDILGGKGGHNSGLPIPLISPSELSWPHTLSEGILPSTPHPINVNNNIAQQQPINKSALILNQSLHSIPMLGARLETYRQLASDRMQNSLMTANTIVSQNARAINYTISLVERTKDLRNWLRQAKNEHELFTSMTNTLCISDTQTASNSTKSAVLESVNLTNNANNGSRLQANL